MEAGVSDDAAQPAELPILLGVKEFAARSGVWSCGPREAMFHSHHLVFV
jgi:hypothetical protein